MILNTGNTQSIKGCADNFIECLSSLWLYLFVRSLLSIFLLLIFFCSGLVSAPGFSALERQIIVKFSHSHDYPHDDHHHGHSGQNSQKSESSKDSHQSPHTHEIAISFCQVLLVSYQLVVSVQEFSQNPFPPPLDTEAPHSCCLDSLFRPPIPT